MLQGGPAVAGLRPQREVEEEEDGPGRRGDEAAITEVPQRDTGHGGRASIALHYTAERERERESVTLSPPIGPSRCQSITLVLVNEVCCCVFRLTFDPM